MTLTVPSPSVITLTVPDPVDATRIQAGLDDPAQIDSVPYPRIRAALQAELRQLDAFLAARPKLQAYRDHLWYVAHHSRLHPKPRQLAALLWCTVWFPRDCG